MNFNLDNFKNPISNYNFKTMIICIVIVAICTIALTACSFNSTPNNQLPVTPETPTSYYKPDPTPVTDCNATVIDCNCRSNYSYPGEQIATDKCITGKMIISSCGGYCPGVPTSSWTAICTCQ